MNRSITSILLSSASIFILQTTAKAEYSPETDRLIRACQSSTEIATQYTDTCIRLEDEKFSFLYQQTMFEMRQSTDVPSSASGMARSLCSLLEAGGTIQDVENTLKENVSKVEPQYRTATAAALTSAYVAGVYSYCPLYADQLR
jgi:hypothetical protein